MKCIDIIVLSMKARRHVGGMLNEKKKWLNCRSPMSEVYVCRGTSQTVYFDWWCIISSTAVWNYSLPTFTMLHCFSKAYLQHGGR